MEVRGLREKLNNHTKCKRDLDRRNSDLKKKVESLEELLQIARDSNYELSRKLTDSHSQTSKLRSKLRNMKEASIKFIYNLAEEE